MVKNKGKGGKNRRRGKADGDMKRELTFKEDGQGIAAHFKSRSTRHQHEAALRSLLVFACSFPEYAQVTRMLGNGRLEAFCFDGVNRLCHIRGKLRKRVWIGVGDIVLLGLREFQDQKVRSSHHMFFFHKKGCMLSLLSERMLQADIILKYDGDEARSLKTYGELPDTVQINAGAENLEGEEFGDDSKSYC